MNRIIVTGDIHSQIIERFSFKKHPELRKLDCTDTIIVCGDIGIAWPGYEKETKYLLNWLGEKPFNIVFLRGNHDNEPWWESCPATTGNASIHLLDGDLRKSVVSNNVFFVTSTAILDIAGKLCLCVGGAKSTDARNLFYPHEEDRIKKARKSGLWHRIIGKSWWPNEGINIDYLEAVLFRTTPDNMRCWRNVKFDYIFTHQSPAEFCNTPYNYRADRRFSNEEQEVLEDIRRLKKFDHWYHGHQHLFCTWTKEDEPPVTCLFYDFVDAESFEWLEQRIVIDCS